jgi:hypothetical protein
MNSLLLYTFMRFGNVSQGIDFDQAITEAIKFADKTGNTLRDYHR